MSLAPYFVLWAFVLGIIAVVLAGLAWLVIPERVAAVVRRLWVADVAAAWLLLALLHHAVFFRPVPGDPPVAEVGELWPLAAVLAGWWALRLVPGPWRREPVAMALAVIAWGWVIGAGFVYIEQTEADRALLTDRPGQVLDARVPPRPLARVRHFFGVAPDHWQLTAETLATLARGQPLDEGRRALVRVELLPHLLEHYELELRRLRAYQYFQIGLLAVLLLGWAFGERVRGEG